MIKFNPEDIFLVTGASSGIGEDIALRLNHLGASLIANGRNMERLEQMRQKAQFPERVHLEAMDLAADISALPDWVKSLSAKHGRLKGLVCSAGVTQICPLKMIDEQTAKKLFDINYFCPTFLAKGFADKRINTGRGSSIVFISSIAGVRGNKSLAIYAGSKAALISTAYVISRELAPNTRVNCISPALVDTNMAKESIAINGDAFLNNLPLGIGLPSDISAMAAFLLSDEARWITGQNYVMDGGKI